MATNKKLDRALRGPGPIEIVLSIILSLVLGVLIGAVHLVFKPVTIVKKAEEATEVGKVYFLEGSANSSKSRQWTRKRQMLTGAGPVDVVFNEDELNAWMATAAPKPAPAAPGAVPSIIEPERVNFRIQDDLLQVGVVGKLSILGYEQEMVVQTRGTFEPAAEGFGFKAKEFYIGSLPTHMIPGLTDYIIQRLTASQELPEDIQAAWKKLTLVAVEGSSLHLTLP
ncbi:MAG: hypothetical protein ACAH89_11340 [Rariglobus sp.]|nr:hypothetical protein [Rariglobus sp.]